MTTATDFLPGLIAVERTPPHPAARAALWLLLALFLAVLAWTSFGTLDIVASAEGKLVPSTYLKIVQPADAGIVKDLLVREGEHVAAGQVLVRMDAVVSEADRQAVLNDYHTKRLALRRIGVRGREMRAGHHHRLGAADEGGVDILLAQRHVGAVLAIEDEREGLRIAHAEDDQGGQPLRVGEDAVGRDTLARHLLADEAAHMLVAHAGDDGGFQAQPRRADGDVGGAAADGLGEAGHVLEPAADLLAVEIDRRAADGDDVKIAGQVIGHNAVPRW